MRKIITFSLLVSWYFFIANSGYSQTIFFQEHFEDSNFLARGWYDNLNFILSDSAYAGLKSAEFPWDVGSVLPQTGASMRHKFTLSEEVYISYYIKFSKSWIGSNTNYGYHQFYLMTNKDGDYSGLAYTHLTTYIEDVGGEPLIAIQDGQNIDANNIGVNMCPGFPNHSENRGVAGCNGDCDGYSSSCYSSGGIYVNVKQWKSGNIYFQQFQGPFYKNDWHLVEVYLKLNSISGGIGQPDGILKYWIDDSLIMDYEDLYFRTGQHPDMKYNQFIIGPYIHNGSPVNQSFWIDELTVADNRGNPAPSPPQNLRIKK